MDCTVVDCILMSKSSSTKCQSTASYQSSRWRVWACSTSCAHTILILLLTTCFSLFFSHNLSRMRERERERDNKQKKKRLKVGKRHSTFSTAAAAARYSSTHLTTTLHVVAPIRSLRFGKRKNKWLRFSSLFSCCCCCCLLFSKEKVNYSLSKFDNDVDDDNDESNKQNSAVCACVSVLARSNYT